MMVQSTKMKRLSSFLGPWESQHLLRRHSATWVGAISNWVTSRMRWTFTDRARRRLPRAGFQGIQHTGSRTLQLLIWLYTTFLGQRNLLELLLNERRT